MLSKINEISLGFVLRSKVALVLNQALLIKERKQARIFRDIGILFQRSSNTFKGQVMKRSWLPDLCVATKAW